MFKKIYKRIKIICLQIKLNKSKDELIDVVLDWNKRLQEKNNQLKEKVEGYERTRDRLIEMGFPTFMSCREYAEKLEKLQEDLKHKKIAIQNRKARIKDLEKENATLKIQLEALSDDIPWNEIKDKSDVLGKLTKAKELLAKWVELFKPKCDSILPPPIQVDTEKFLKE